MDLKTSKPISIEEAKEMLESRKKEGELGYEQAQALEHCEKLTKRSPKEAQKLVEKIKKNNEKLSNELITKLVDISPTTISTVRSIVSKEKIEINDEEATAIIKELE